MYQQIVQPNLNVVGQSGMCLAYVRAVFGATYSYPSATVAWQNAQFKHPNEQPPANVSVPVWFSYNGPDGHVAVWSGGKVYSTSAVGDKVFNSIQELCNWMGEGMTYLGWSEDVDKLQVVKEEIMPGVKIQGTPAAVSWGPDRIDIVATGTDGKLYHKWFNKQWNDWECLTDKYLVGMASGELTISSWGVNRLDVFFTGSGGDLVHIWFDGKWSGPESLGTPA